uniref:Cilia and flagella associated protein 47 n=1 Tax=Prolemur simus TaxID=1328070 RepID=A0A8C9DPY6_PROSS
MDRQKGSLIPLDIQGPKKDMQLRVSPLELKFLDTLAGRVYRLPITIHNLGRGTQKIRFQEPVKPQFKLVLPSLDKKLASGLQMTAMVEYHPDKNEDSFDQLLILAGNKTIEIPLIGLIPICQLEIESVVNFGTLVANSKAYCREVTIVNHGKVPGEFKTEYQGQLPILIFPASGIVEPKSSKVIKVNFCTDQPRIVDEKAIVSLQGRPDIVLNIKARVVERIIELLNVNYDKKLKCIHFGSIFFGTSKLEYARLYNNSPEPINWVAIMQDNSVGEELGTNIRQRTDIALNNLTYLNKIKDVDITALITCVPNEGALLPYQKTVITFCFSPKLIIDSKKDIEPSHRQDYALFMRFDSVGSKDGFLRDDNYKTVKGDRFQKVELALTGSGLPVLLHFDPGKVLNFTPCVMGESSEIQCIIQNQSKTLPVTYRFKKTAQFKIDPARGTINEGCSQNLIFSFIPRQIGVFKVKQLLEIIGLVADENLLSSSMKPFHHIYLDFSSICKTANKRVVMKINPGISPLVTNPTGQFVAKDLTKYKDSAPVAMLQSAKTHIHDHRSNKESVKDALIAFPNDRAASIRSGDPDKHFRTIFTKIPRYNYVDPDFAHTEFEKMEKKIHNYYYAIYTKYLRSAHLPKKTEREGMFSHNDIDLGLQPASGLKSPSVSEAEAEEELALAECPINPNQLLSTRNIASREKASLRRKIHETLKSEPSTPQEINDCTIILTPKHIHQVIVGPSVLNFGNICVNSASDHLLHVINMLPIHILIQLDTNLEELQKTKQFSYVIPPTCNTNISVIFESTMIGTFWKSFTFTVNNTPGGHILVMAVVQPVKLELSSNELVLRPQGFLAKTCFRGTIRLYNRQNCSAQFGWQLINTGKEMAFSICPANGFVEAYSSLECEVTWQPSFGAPERGEFALHVFKGNTLTLKCVAHLGHTKITLWEPRVLFNNCPQRLTTWKKAILLNVGQNHAYFQIYGQSLLPTINIIPSEGVIPAGGISVLNISCTPTVAEKFETRAQVAIRRANVIDLKISGSVEIADIEINPDAFNFSGTYIGTTHIIPFLIKNKGITRARVEFNLEDFPEFSMDFIDKSGECTDPAVPSIYYFEVEENTSLKCGIAFSPKRVITYNFTFQVKINFFEASKLYTEYLSNPPLNPKTTPLIGPCYVHVTVLQAPLILSSTKFVFEMPLHEMDPVKKVTKTENLTLDNISKQDVRWIFDIRNTGTLFKDDTFKFSTPTGTLKPQEKCTISISFCPQYPEKYTVDIPILLNDNPVCYRILHLTGEVKSPKLLFEPPFIIFTPIPLDTTTAMDINILPQNYFRSSTLHVQIPRVRLLDCDEVHPLSVKFPKGRGIIGSSSGINDPLTCHLSFKSSKPVSFFTNLHFCDDENNRFSLPVSAAAENCILTIYPYIAIHLDKYRICLKKDKDGSPVETKDSGSPSTSIKKTSITTKFSDTELARGNLYVGMEIIPENLGLDKSEPSKKDDRSVEKEETNEQFFTLGEGTKAYNFFQKIVNAAQTWFGLFGWPEGPHSFSIPETIRRDVYKIQFYSSKSSPKKYSLHHDYSKYNKTIYDVVLHLSGTMPPEINSSQSLPVDDNERLIQLHLQHSSLLNFLNIQGGYLSHVLPEFLFEPEDYKKWIEITSSTDTVPVSSCTRQEKEKCSFVIDMTEFEAWSKRAWTDVFLQVYKVLVLSRVVPYGSNNMPPINLQNTPKINPCFVSSNIYSNSERILLSWLNTNYENARHVIWKSCHKDIIPSERWIVNFDKDLLDGLVFATQLGAYCPFLIESHLINMYTRPKCPEQCLHNNLIVINAFHEIGFDMNVQAIDICDPNPILMLMLCVYMYERLPTYLPKKVVPLRCMLHDTVEGQILLKNSSLITLVYTAKIVGRDAADFSLSQTGNIVTISPKDKIYINLQFTSRCLHCAKASLLLISKPKNATGGATMAFALKGEVIKFKAIEVIKCKSPCYTWKKVTFNVKNPFQTDGDFRIILVESSTFVSSPSQVMESTQYMKHDDVKSSGCDTLKGCSHAPEALRTSIKSDFIREFFCSMPTVYLKGKETSSLELFFVPLDVHVRYCVIVFSNKKIGEFVYVLEGKGILPLPSRFLPMDPPSNPVSYNSTPEEECNTDSPVLYLKCRLHQILDVDLKVPLMNEAKEKAYIFAAQQQMSNVEYERRLITGTLESSSVRVAVALLGLSKVESGTLFHTSELKKAKSILYTAKLSLPEYFFMPEKIYIPQIPELQGVKPAEKSAAGASVTVPLRFFPLSPGRYPCRILLTSRYDVRVYDVEGVVNEEHPEATFEFETPACEPLTQNIPIKNETDKECRYRVTIEGEWFYGPSVLCVRPEATVEYPLTFKPIFECEIPGKLVLQNEVDGMEHMFYIKGIGKKSLALEHIIMECEVGETTTRPIIVPNYTNSVLKFEVTSDLPIVWGNPHIIIDPDKSSSYTLHVCPWKRGIFKGAISFSGKISQTAHFKEEKEQFRKLSIQKSLTEVIHTFIDDDTDDDISNVTVWYSLEIHSTPSLPINIIEMECTALDTICIGIPLSNPKDRVINLDVEFTSPALDGYKTVTLNPLECTNYVIWYSPATTGYKNESIIFQPEMAEEFWYLLKLTVELPKATTVPEIQCDLGKYVTQTIPLVNPTHETLELEVTNSNPENFILDVNPSQLIITPHSTIELSVHFYPSMLGRADHQACINFSCDQFKEWKFYLSGIGLFPKPLDTGRITTCLGCHSLITMSFKNPTSEDVLIDILLTNQEDTNSFDSDRCWDYFIDENAAFGLDAMSETQGIALPPKGHLDISVLFVPPKMKLYKTIVVVQMMRANTKSWPIDNFDELDINMKRTMGVDSGEIQAIQWMYPILGLPEAPFPKSPPVVIQCQSRKRVEENVEVTLHGDFFGKHPTQEMTEFLVIPKRNSCNGHDSFSEMPKKREFEYEIQFESEVMEFYLEPCVALYLINKSYSTRDEMITLIFTVVFTPQKPLRSNIILKIECITFGIWKFPITLVATEPDVDAIINIVGVGLFKESIVDFRLTSQTRNSEPFTAYFLPGSDPEISVRPQAGKLLPYDTKGTLIIVGFKPRMYSRKYKAKLVIETADMYWLYDINGLPHSATPLMNVKAKIDATNEKYDHKPVRQRNFLHENAKLLSTGVSSTIKGAPLVMKNK